MLRGAVRRLLQTPGRLLCRRSSAAIMEPVYDFRSDTVTKPTPEMVGAMFAPTVQVGDSVYGEDPTENALETFVADLLGMEKGLFVCTGVMSNQIALRVHSHLAKSAMFGEVLFASGGHLGFRELGGPVFNSRIVPVPVPFSGNYMTVDDVKKHLCLAHDLHGTTTIGVCVENTMAGQVMPIEELRKISELARASGIFIHLDGARLWNASVATGVPLRDWAKLVDSVSVCFSKGLGAPIGSMLLGSNELIRHGREVRKALGGGWRQSGYLAAACQYAVQHHVQRLADDHSNARHLYEQLLAIGLKATAPDTNIVVVDVSPVAGLSWQDHVVPAMRARGIIVGGSRIVVHLQTPRAAIDRFVAMNQALLDPNARKPFPELLETYIYEPGSFAGITKFNRRGALLASGCHNGKIVVWDFITRTKAVVMHSHSHPITSLSWSKSNRKLLSSSLDHTVKLWSVETGAEDLSFDAGEPVLNACLHPRNASVFAMSVASRVPELVTHDGTKRVPVPSAVAPQKDALVSMGALSFNRDGSRLLWGDTTGRLHEVDVEAWRETRVASCGGESIGIKQIVFNHKGTLLLVNCNDRKIRLFDAATLEQLRAYVDPVKRCNWKTCRFSANADYVIGGSADKAEHHIYIWDRERGNLLKTIEGPKEGILDLQWHPLAPIVVSCAASSGVIFIWTTNLTEHWSAYAPNFTELHQNEIYQEREDEFDIMDSEEHLARKKAKQDQQEEADVDVWTEAPIEGLTSEEEGDLIALPAVPPATASAAPAAPAGGGTK